MNSKDSLRMIAEELRQFSRAGYGVPPSVRVKTDTLIEYANRLEEIANAEAGSQPEQA